MTPAAVTGSTWLLSLHVLAAFAVGAPVAALLITAVSLRTGDPSRTLALGGLVRSAAIVFRVGVAGTLAFGLWMVFTRDGLSILDAWVIAALVLWVVIGGLGDTAISRLRKLTRGSGEAPGASPDPARLRRVLWLEASAAVAVIAELGVMLWRPGS